MRPLSDRERPATEQGPVLRQGLPCGAAHDVQLLLEGAPDLGRRAGLIEAGLATLRQKRGAGGSQRIPGQENDPLTEGGRLLLQPGVERWSIQLRHPQVTQDQVIVPLLELGQGALAIVRRINAVAVVVEEPGQRPDKTRLIVNQQNLRW